MSYRLVSFVKPGVSFGMSMVDMKGVVIFKDEPPDTDFPDPMPHDTIVADLLDDNGVIIVHLSCWDQIAYYLNGHDCYRLFSAEHESVIELDFGHD